MEVLIFALVVILVACLLLWLARTIPMPSPFNWIVQAIIVLVAAIAIIGRLGVFHTTT